MSLIADLGLALNAHPMTRYPHGWHYAFPPWAITLNGQRRPMTIRAVTVPPFCALLEYNGWAVGIVNAFGGELATSEKTGEEALIAALEREIACVKERADAPRP